MPDLTDLRDAFALFEQLIPDNYRSSVVQERLARLHEPGGVAATVPHTGHRRRLAAVLAAAAAVVALAITLASLGGSADKNSQVGNQPTTSTKPSPAPTSRTTAPTRHASTTAVPADTMPADASALIRYVGAGTPVPENAYQRGASQQGEPLQATPGITEFTTPSGNISCGMTGSAGTASVACVVDQYSFNTPPKPASCQQHWGASWLSIQSGTVVRGLCLGGPPFALTSTVLPYGSTIELASQACRSESAFLACADVTTGHGFAVDRTTIRIY